MKKAYIKQIQDITSASGSFQFNIHNMNENSVVSSKSLNTPITNTNPKVVVGKVCHIYDGDKRLRIFGTNTISFPEKNMAEKNAKLLASMRYNFSDFNMLILIGEMHLLK